MYSYCNIQHTCNRVNSRIAALFCLVLDAVADLFTVVRHGIRYNERAANSARARGHPAGRSRPVDEHESGEPGAWDQSIHGASVCGGGAFSRCGDAVGPADHYSGAGGGGFFAGEDDPRSAEEGEHT